MAKSFYTTGTGSQQTLTPSQVEKIPVYDTVSDAEADLSNLSEGQIIATKGGGDGVTNAVTNGDMRPVTSNAVYDRFASRKVILWEGTATEGDTLDFTNKNMDLTEYEQMEVVFAYDKLLVQMSQGTGNNVRLKALRPWVGTDFAQNVGTIDYEQWYVVDIIGSKLVNCSWFQKTNGEWSKGGTFTINKIIGYTL